MRNLYMQYFLTTPNTHLEENVSITEELKTWNIKTIFTWNTALTQLYKI